MPHIGVADAQAWTEPTKLPISALDAALEDNVTKLVFGMLTPTYNTTGWTSEATTPALVRTIIAMHYVAWLYDKHYAQEAEESAYANTLRRYADANIAGLLAGTITLDEYVLPAEVFNPSFFPNDLSSANEPTVDNPSDGGPSFMMGSVF